MCGQNFVEERQHLRAHEWRWSSPSLVMKETGPSFPANPGGLAPAASALEGGEPPGRHAGALSLPAPHLSRTSGHLLRLQTEPHGTALPQNQASPGITAFRSYTKLCSIRARAQETLRSLLLAGAGLQMNTRALTHCVVWRNSLSLPESSFTQLPHGSNNNAKITS